MALLAVSSCDSVSTPYKEALSPTYILKDFAFDSSGTPTLAGWKYQSEGTDTVAIFKKDVPPGSPAAWSLLLAPGWIPSTNSVCRTFTGLSSGIYSLSVRSRYTSAENVHGRMSIETKSPMGPTHEKKMEIGGDNAWSQTFLVDTLSLTQNDTLRVLLDGGVCEVCTGGLLFHTISLAKLR